MDIQMIYSIIYVFLILILIVCSILAKLSKKVIGKYTIMFDLCIVITIIANIFIILAPNRTIVIYSYYLYYIGMTLVMLSIVSFTNKYCQGVRKDKTVKHRKPTIMYIIGGIDILQLLCGFVFNHVFSLKEVILNNKTYYKSIPSIGLTLHRLIDYFIFICIITIFIIAIKNTSKLYREKYVIIFITLLISGALQAFFIISNLPIDRSVIAHAITGTAVFYFSIKYRPMRLLDEVLSSIAANMNDSVYVFDSNYNCVWSNDTGYRLLNVPNGETDLIKDAILDMFGNINKQGDNWSKHITINNRYYSLEKTSIKSEHFVDGCFLIIEDNTEQQLNMEKELYNSTHDKLTKLYNINYLYEAIAKELITNSNEGYYLIYMNIRNFKLINDIFGKDFGDITIIQLATWIRKTIKKNGIYGRLIGDKFGICIPIGKFDEQKFLNDLSDFVVKYKKMEYKIIIHIGIYVINNSENITDVSLMFDRANLALSTISNVYKTTIKYYDNDIKNNLIEEQKLITDLDDAINNNHIKPYLQPIVDTNGKIVGAETLARWIHPVLGFLPPIKFIPIFEKNSIIINLDKYIWRRTCEILNSWKNTKYENLWLSINISPKDFYFIDVVEELQNLIHEFDIDPSKLRIEITESAMMSDPEEKVKIFDKLRHSGFIVEMDDFGSGYSSLNMLKDMPVDVLKLDMKFLSDNTDKSDTIIKNIINLSNELHMITLTEGVETEQQFNQLKQMSCSLFQGYYFAKPMPLEDFENFIKTEI